MRVALFLDGKNFYAGWRDSAESRPMDFTRLTEWLMKQVGGDCLFGSFYYTGVSGDNEKLKAFLETLSHNRSFYINTFDRKHASHQCSHCGEVDSYTVEKEVDTSLVADMVYYAATNAFDVAVLLSGDADLRPALEKLRLFGKKAYIASWNGKGMSSRLRSAAFDHIELMKGFNEFKREGTPSINNSDITETDPRGYEKLLIELDKAEKHFQGTGYVGFGFFITKWRSSELTTQQDQRRALLDRAIEDSMVDVYSVDGYSALRLTENGHAFLAEQENEDRLARMMDMD